MRARLSRGTVQAVSSCPMEPDPQEDRAAAEQLLPLIYDQLRDLAGSFLRREKDGHTLQPTALVHEAYMRVVVQTGVRWQNPTHLYAVSAQAMRRVLVDHARKKTAGKRGGGAAERVELDEAENPITGRAVDLLALDDALNKLAELSERQARVVEMRFFAGLSVEEVAEAMGVSVSTIAGDWRMARAWLRTVLSH